MAYGSPTQPDDLGSGGGDDNEGPVGGAGGGAVKIFADGTLTATMRAAPRDQIGLALGAYGLTEPSAGSDAAMQQTIATTDGDTTA